MLEYVEKMIKNSSHGVDTMRRTRDKTPFAVV
jgi:hypothetical protein